MLLSWLLWMTIVFSVLGAGYAYIGFRLINTMGWTPHVRTAAWFGLAVALVLLVLSMFLFRSLENLHDAWAWVIYVGLGFLSLAVTLLFFRDLLLLGEHGLTALAGLFRKNVAVTVDPARRQFLLQATNLGVLGTAGALTAYGVFEARRQASVVNLTIPLPKLPPAFEGFRIVQITDIHAGLTVKRDWIESIAQQVDSLTPDLIALTGDLADGSVTALRHHVEPLAALRAPHGKFFVTGNHEYYSGAEPWVEEANRMGYRVLLNEHTLISRHGARIVLAGVTDHGAGEFLPHHRSDPAKAIAGAEDDLVRILLAHQPRSILGAESLGYGLVISGHTHGGQFFPWNLLATLAQPYIKGLHKRQGTWVYVSKGTGYWGPPVRLAARSEITVFTLTAAPPEGQDSSIRKVM
jgi:predicted MPP superfamily phosphohydrolase